MCGVVGWNFERRESHETLSLQTFAVLHTSSILLAHAPVDRRLGISPRSFPDHEPFRPSLTFTCVHSELSRPCCGKPAWFQTGSVEPRSPSLLKWAPHTHHTRPTLSACHHQVCLGCGPGRGSRRPSVSFKFAGDSSSK